MIIIPTEKRFDWKHAPIVLFILVILNTLIYFGYQFGDDAKVYDALISYKQQGFLEKEWPVYQEYLKDREMTDQLEQDRALYLEKSNPQSDYRLLYDIVTDEDFYAYLEKNSFDLFHLNYIEKWALPRLEINNKIQSVSTLAYGLIPNQMSIVKLFTHQFLHGSVMHLLGNMFFLIICGFAVEAAIGHLKFLIFYLISGAAGGLLFSFLEPTSSTPLVGASGSISGVMAMYLGVFRFKKIEFFYWLFVFVGYFRAPAFLILPFYIGKELYEYFGDTGSNVAFMAHVGGFIAGTVLMVIAYLLNPKMLNEEYIEEDQDLPTLQQDLAKVYENIGKSRFNIAIKALDYVINTYGAQFDWLILKFNILKMTKNKHSTQAMQELIKMRNLKPHQLDQLDNLWKSNICIDEKFSNEDLYQFAWIMANASNYALSEQLFVTLEQQKNRHPSLNMLAKKLAVIFSKLNINDKKIHYELAANRLSHGSST
jgi:membrane associated rhomboid family serine protease